MIKRIGSLLISVFAYLLIFTYFSLISCTDSFDLTPTSSQIIYGQDTILFDTTILNDSETVITPDTVIVTDGVFQHFMYTYYVHGGDTISLKYENEGEIKILKVEPSKSYVVVHFIYSRFDQNNRESTVELRFGETDTTYYYSKNINQWPAQFIPDVPCIDTVKGLIPGTTYNMWMNRSYKNSNWSVTRSFRTL